MGRMARGVVAFSVVLAAAGCLFVDARGDFKGDILFAWGFNNANSCGQAGVDEVAITLRARGNNGSRYGPTSHDCSLGTFRLQDVAEGEYTLTLEGLQVVNDEGVILYAESTDLVVVGGSTTDLGTVWLRQEDVQVPTGNLKVDWKFQYGTDGTLDCTFAGVRNVRLTLVGPSPFDDVYDCQSGPAELANVKPGSYTLTLTGEGVDAQNNVVALYREPNIQLTVAEGQLTDLGLRQLNQIESNFADLEVSWAFAGGQSCASAGVDRLQVKIYRGDSTTAEDSFDWACTGAPVTRANFVPAEYVTVITAIGNEGGTTVHWSGENRRQVGPGDTEQYVVTLQRQQ